MEIVMPLVTVFVTFICGHIAKRVSWLNKNLIPVQNALIGILIAIIDWAITKDFKVAIAFSGIFAGGTYDIPHNLQKMLSEEQKEKLKKVFKKIFKFFDFLKKYIAVEEDESENKEN